MKKLARDKIPNIIEAQGRKCVFYVADDAEYKQALYAKLQEEVAEFLLDKNAEELADVLEVVHAIAQFEFGGYAVVESVRQKKAVERGGFDKKIIMDVIK